MSEIEREYKWLVDREQFEQLLAGFESQTSKKKRYIQINYYYDTPDFALCCAGDTLRVRQKENGLTAEYKTDKRMEGGLRFCREYSADVANLPQEIVLRELFPEFAGNEDEAYGYIGNLVTERFGYVFDAGTISCDKNWYLGRMDYEIEFEIATEATEPMAELPVKIQARLLALPPSGINPGKYTRFIKAWGNVQKGEKSVQNKKGT